jgi:serine/threonine protein kinase
VCNCLSAQVYLGYRAAGQRVALKVLSAAAAAQPATLGRLRREVGFMRTVSSDANIVRFYGASLDHVADAVLVME